MPTLKPGIAMLDQRTAPVPEKTADPYYNSPEHKAWALAVKKLAGWKCQTCGKAAKPLYADHIVELKDGGAPFDVANGAAKCASCHTKKTIAEREKRMLLP